MTNEFLFKQIKLKSSFLCVGLDIDLDKVPPHLLLEKDPIFAFAKAIIDATHSYAVAFKPNLAFFEFYGVKGWKAFNKVMDYLNTRYPNHFIIADAKRGDIGNSSKRYAKAFFETYDVDAVTIVPYMGRDSVEPFLSFEGKFAVLLTLTSNEGSIDFQYTREKKDYLFEKVLKKSLDWKNADRLMYVVGAKNLKAIRSIRRYVPNSFLLIPGIGAQGGNLSDVAQSGMNSNCGILVNSSRDILYASNEKNFAEFAAKEAEKLQLEMANLLKDRGLV